MPHPIAVGDDLLLGRDELGPTTAGSHQGCCRKWQLLVAIGILLAAGALGALVGVMAERKQPHSCTAAGDVECGSHGFCRLVDGVPACFCAGGWKGVDCSDSTGCDFTAGSSPCKNGATCTASGGNHNCACASGWSGADCSHATGCDSNPCKNGATCTASGGNHSCACASGWSGADCSHATGCDSNPCKNGATCTASGGNHNCACASGWSGADCSHATGCDSNPCKNGATCTASGGNHSCACASGWSGADCSHGVCFIRGQHGRNRSVAAAATQRPPTGSPASVRRCPPCCVLTALCLRVCNRRRRRCRERSRAADWGRHLQLPQGCGVQAEELPNVLFWGAAGEAARDTSARLRPPLRRSRNLGIWGEDLEGRVAAAVCLPSFQLLGGCNLSLCQLRGHALLFVDVGLCCFFVGVGADLRCLHPVQLCHTQRDLHVHLGEGMRWRERQRQQLQVVRGEKQHNGPANKVRIAFPTCTD
jgi:hypothetical protein